MVLSLKKLAAESLYIDRDSVTGSYVRKYLSMFLYAANHLVINRDSFHRSRHVTMLAVQISEVNASKRDFDNCIPLVLYYRLGLLKQIEFSF